MMEALNIAHIFVELGAEDLTDRGLHQTSPINHHYSFWFTRSASPAI